MGEPNKRRFFGVSAPTSITEAMINVGFPLPMGETVTCLPWIGFLFPMSFTDQLDISINDTLLITFFEVSVEG